MATQASTLSEALEIYNDRYQTALSNNAKRDIVRFKSNTNQINSYYDIVNVAIGENNFSRAQVALDEIVVILNAQGISISDPVTLPLAVGIYPSPAIITVPVNEVGLNPVYTEALSKLFIFQGGTDVSSDYTITVTEQINVTAVIQNGNEVKINDLTADTGSVSVQAVKTGFATLTFTINVYKYYDAQEGISLNTYPSNILVPVDSVGSNPDYTNAISEISVFIGRINDTINWTYVITGTSNVTAVIQNQNEVKVNGLTLDTGSVTVEASKIGYDTISFLINVNRLYAGADGADGADGLGWTGGSYNSGDGTVTFTSDDGLGFQTDDLRGASGGGTFQDTNYSIRPTAVEGTLGIVAPGDGAVDFQTFRSSNPALIASGDNSFIAGGINNQADGNYDFVAGWTNETISIDGSNSIGGGNGNTISGIGTFLSSIGGGSQNLITAAYSSIIGSFNTLSNIASYCIGYGSRSTTNGEIIFSASNSPVQKSMFLLEEVTSSINPTALQVFGRNSGASSVTTQNIQVAASTLLTGTMDIMGVQGGSLFRRKMGFMAVRFAAGNVFIRQGDLPLITSISDYDLSDFTPTALTVTGTATEVIVTVTSNAVTDTKWTCNTEVTLMDI